MMHASARWCNARYTSATALPDRWAAVPMHDGDHRDMPREHHEVDDVWKVLDDCHSHIINGVSKLLRARFNADERLGHGIKELRSGPARRAS